MIRPEPLCQTNVKKTEEGYGKVAPRFKRISQLQAIIIALAYGTLNRLLSAASVVLWPTRRPNMARNILIYRIGNIGDVTCALPAMRAIRRAYPDAHLTLCTSPGPKHLPGAKDLLVDIEWIDEIFTYYPKDIKSLAGRFGLLKELRQRRIDLWINLSASADSLNLLRELRDMLFVRLVGPHWARGWAIDTISWGAQAQSLYLSFPGEVERLLSTIHKLGIDPQPVEFDLPRPANVVKRLDALTGDEAQVPWIAIAPGCKRSTNRWPTKRFKEVAQALAEVGCTVVVIGGPSDVGTGEEIIQVTSGSGLNLAGQLTLAESVEALRRCQLAICVDSGIQHLASAVGTPTLSLFSAWQMRGKWYPYGHKNRVIQKWVHCHTCLLSDCPNGNQCMADIKASEVRMLIRQMINN